MIRRRESPVAAKIVSARQSNAESCYYIALPGQSTKFQRVQPNRESNEIRNKSDGGNIFPGNPFAFSRARARASAHRPKKRRSRLHPLQRTPFRRNCKCLTVTSGSGLARFSPIDLLSAKCSAAALRLHNPETGENSPKWPFCTCVRLCKCMRALAKDT